MKIRYREGYKYQLADDAAFKMGFMPHKSILTKWVEFGSDGWLIIKAGYAWDGPSGPTFDDHTNMRGSLMHDACYQLMRMGLLDEEYRKHVDIAFKNMCIEDGMNWVRAELYFEGVHLFGQQYAEQQEDKVYEAP